MKPDLYLSALDLMRDCSSPYGFVATPHRHLNYFRVWGRDSSIMGLAALGADDEQLVRMMRHSLETLIRFQGARGEIPSNVDPKHGVVSYGQTAGRVDATTWFLVAFGQYCLATGEKAFARKHLESVERAVSLLEAWEFNRKGLLYVPEGGDWADEFIQHGYVLYDQVLYYAALKNYREVLRMLKKNSPKLSEKITRLGNLIKANYWVEDTAPASPYVYNEPVVKRGKKLVRGKQEYWLPAFSPSGYENRFDAMANILVSLAGLATPEQQERVDSYVAAHCGARTGFLIPAFRPVITPGQRDWERLRSAYSFSFKNKPYEYHNGGLWPMITGLYAADLAVRGKHDVAKSYLEGLAYADCPPGNSKKTFPEYLHGKTKRPKGAIHLGWSAAGTLLALQAFETKKIHFV